MERLLQRLFNYTFWKDLTHPDRIAYTYSELIEPLGTLLPKVLEQLEHYSLTKDLDNSVYSSLKKLKNTVPRIINAEKDTNNENKSMNESYSPATKLRRSDS